MAAIANQFCALEYNVTERRVDDDTSFENEVNEAVKAALSSLDAGTQPGTKSTNKNAKATANEGGAITGELIALLIAALQPVLVKSVTAAVTTAVACASKQIMFDLQQDLGAPHGMEADMRALRAQGQTQKFEIDKLQQCSRRENIFGIAEKKQTTSPWKWLAIWAST